MTLAVFAMISSLLLSAVNQGRRQEIQDYEQQEVLNVAKMAVQTGQKQLSINGIEVSLVQDEQQTRVFHENKEVLHVEKD